MVSDDVIVMNEFLNDGGSIHIYYSEMYHGFVAYGFSAFQTMKTLKAKEIEVQQEYSAEIQMPMVIINKVQMEAFLHRGVITKQGTVEGKYYHMESFIMLNEAAYAEWAQSLRDMK